MNINLAEELGFCFGVKKALDRINSLDNKEDVYVLGKLIHNPQVIEELKKKGVRFVDDIGDVSSGVLVISAHGVSDDVIEKADEKGLRVIDTTCPLVKNVHNITRELEDQGYRIIIFGDKEHTEVKGIKGNLKDPLIISDVSELSGIPDGKYALVSQTTQDVVKFNGVSNELKNRFRDLVVSDTICSATKLRQESAEKISKEVELMIVIGGYNSANTKRLADICGKYVETKHIESADELRKEWFIGKASVGVTAGASTPEGVVREVVDRINDNKAIHFIL